MVIRAIACSENEATWPVMTTFGNAGQRMVGADRLVAIDIDAGASETAAAERLDQGVLVDDRSARRVDDDRSGGQTVEDGSIDHGSRRREQWRMDGQDVTAARELRQVEQLDREGLAEIPVRCRVRRGQLASEADEATRDGAPDRAEPDDPDAQSGEVAADRCLSPGPGTDRDVVLAQSAEHREHEGQGVIRDGLVVRARRPDHRDAGGCRRIEIDRIDAHARSRDGAQARQPGKEVGRVPLGAGNDGPCIAQGDRKVVRRGTVDQLEPLDRGEARRPRPAPMPPDAGGRPPR